MKFYKYFYIIKWNSYGYIIVDLCLISIDLNCIMQLKQFYNIATKVSSRKKCHYFWWSTWLLMVNCDIYTDVHTFKSDC